MFTLPPDTAGSSISTGAHSLLFEHLTYDKSHQRLDRPRRLRSNTLKTIFEQAAEYMNAVKYCGIHSQQTVGGAAGIEWNQNI